MPAEVIQPNDRPTILFENVIGDQTVNKLISGKEDSEEFFDTLSTEIQAFSSSELRALMRLTLNGLSTENEYWSQDRRDILLDFITLIDPQKIRPELLLQDYLQVVNTQNEHSDPYGTIYQLLEAGDFIASYLPIGQNTRNQVNTAWNLIAEKFEGEDKEYIEKEKNNLLARIPLGAAQLMGNDDHDRLGWREQPTFDEPEQALHNKYIEVTKKQGTFKLALWENTPWFRALCVKHGIALERFWNINNPDEVVSALASICSLDSFQARPVFDKALRLHTGLALEEITEEQTRVLADEVVKAAIDAKREVLARIGNFDETVSKFLTLIEKTKDEGPKAQKALRTQINGFLQNNGLGVSPANLDELVVILQDKKQTDEAKATFDSKYQSRKESAQQIEEIFRLDEKPTAGSLISRQREDLYLGDLTGDCTAYHLHVGVNAYTVPIWLSNPGFNMFKIPGSGKLNAKLGILLAVADGKPVLVVDSFEVGKGIQDEEEAIESIKRGFTLLKQWAETIGLNGVYLNTISNSTGAMDLIRSFGEKSMVKSIYTLGGLYGIAELRKNLIGEKAEERIYLQSYAGEPDDEEEYRPRTVQKLEKVISSVIERADAGRKQLIGELARRQDWEGLFSQIVAVNAPLVAELLGTDWATYEQLMQKIDVDEIGTPYRNDSNPAYSKYELPVYTSVSEQIIEDSLVEDERYTDEDKTIVRTQQVEEIDDFLGLVKFMEKQGITPEYALRTLYRQAGSKDEEDLEKRMLLKNYLPKLAI